MIDHAQWFDSFVRASWQGALLVLAAWAAVRLFKNASASMRSWLWPIVLTKFVLVTFIVWELPVLAPPDVVDVPAQSGLVMTSASVAQPATASPMTIEQALFALWAVGVALIVVRSLREYTLLRRIEKRATIASDKIIRLCEQTAEKHMTVKVHPDVPMPLVFGVFKPLVLLPSTLEEELSDEQLSMVLAHEVAHIQRRDTATAVYVFVCQTMFFFHPAVWLAKREWQIARESACDQYAMHKTNTESRDYADMLIKVSVGAKRAPAFALSAVPAYKTLHRRIDEMNNTSTKSGKARVTWIIAVVLISAAALPFALVQKKPIFGAGIFETFPQKRLEVVDEVDARPTNPGLAIVVEPEDVLETAIEVETRPVVSVEQSPLAGLAVPAVAIRSHVPKSDARPVVQVGTAIAVGVRTAPLAGETAPVAVSRRSEIRTAPTVSSRSVSGLPGADTAPTVALGSGQSVAATSSLPRLSRKPATGLPTAETAPEVAVGTGQSASAVSSVSRRPRTPLADVAVSSDDKMTTGSIARVSRGSNPRDGETGIVISVKGKKYMVSASTKAKFSYDQDKGFVQIVEADGGKFWVSIAGSKAKGEGEKLEVKVKKINGTTYNVAIVPKKKR